MKKAKSMSAFSLPPKINCSSKDFVDGVKHFYTDLINLFVKDDKEKLHVFDSSGLYLTTKKNREE